MKFSPVHAALTPTQQQVHSSKQALHRLDLGHARGAKHASERDVNVEQSAEPSKEQKEIKEAARKFEAFVTAQLFKQMGSSAEVMGAESSLAKQFFGESLAEHVADLSAERGELGLASVLQEMWSRSVDASSDKEPASIETLRATYNLATRSGNFTKASSQGADEGLEDHDLHGDTP